MRSFINYLKKMRPATIRGQLVLGIVLVHFALMTFFVVDLIRRQLRFLRQQSQEQALSLANELAVNSNAYVIGDDFDGLERLVVTYKNFPNLNYAMVLSPDNVALAHSDPAFQGKKATDSISQRLRQDGRSQVLLQDESILDVAAPVLQRGRTIGWARVGISQDYIYTNFQSMYRNGLFYVLAAMAIGLMVALYIGKRLSASLTGLADAADSIRSGDRTRRVALTGSSETIRLATAFNEMLEVLVRNERMLAMVLDNMPVGAYILQGEQFVYINPVFEQITGYNREDILRKLKPDLLIHAEDLAIVRRLWNARSSGSGRGDHYSFRIIRSDGSVIFVEAIVSLIVFNQRPATVGSIIDITDRLQEENRINKAVIDAQEQERMQIGMELHDNVQQILAGSILTLDYAEHQFDDRASALQAVVDAKEYVNKGIYELRRLSHQLAPAMRTREDLPEKIRELANTMDAGRLLDIRVEAAGFEGMDDEVLGLTFYRIVQEQLSNIQKHAEATKVVIRLTHTEDCLTLSIRDNGKGFETAGKAPGIGLENMRRRTAALNGEIRIISAPGNGCEVLLRVPHAT